MYRVRFTPEYDGYFRTLTGYCLDVIIVMTALTRSVDLQRQRDAGA